jgi:hypothetical protein
MPEKAAFFYYHLPQLFTSGEKSGLVQEINRLLDEKRNRLLNKQSGADESQTESDGDCS